SGSGPRKSIPAPISKPSRGKNSAKGTALYPLAWSTVERHQQPPVFPEVTTQDSRNRRASESEGQPIPCPPTFVFPDRRSRRLPRCHQSKTIPATHAPATAGGRGQAVPAPPAPLARPLLQARSSHPEFGQTPPW